MLVMHNKSQSWYSDEPFEGTENAGILTDVSPVPPPGLEDPTAGEILMRYDLVIIDADDLDHNKPKLLESKKMLWDGAEWTIDGVLTWYHNDELLYRFWISKIKQ